MPIQLGHWLQGATCIHRPLGFNVSDGDQNPGTLDPSPPVLPCTFPSLLASLPPSLHLSLQSSFTGRLLVKELQLTSTLPFLTYFRPSASCSQNLLRSQMKISPARTQRVWPRSPGHELRIMVCFSPAGSYLLLPCSEALPPGTDSRSYFLQVLNEIKANPLWLG